MVVPPYIILWSVVILKVSLVLPTGAVSNNESTDDLALQILSVSSFAVNVQWNCIQAKNFTLTWKGMIKNAVEKWERMDTKVLDLCQDAGNLGEEVNTTIIDLEEGLEYRLSIDGNSSVHFNTLTSVPSGPPIYLRGHPVNQATIHVSWTRPKLLDCNGDILQYIIMVESDSDEHNYTFNVTSECISRTCMDIQCLSHSFSVPENELVPHKKYSVKIAAVNANGTGPFSNAIMVMSGDDEPGPPENLRVTNSGEELEEFILQWDMPRNPNGAILGYKIEYGVTNDTDNNNGYTNSMNFTLKLFRNETYTIAVYAENSVGIGNAAEIQWPSLDIISSIKAKNHKNVIIGCCMGAFSLILLTCTVVVYVRWKYKKSSNKSSSKFYPAPIDVSTATVVINKGYIFVENGTHTYDYPYTEVNGARALPTNVLQSEGSRKSNRNSTSTCGYIEMPALINNNSSKPRSASFAVPNASRIVSGQRSTVSSSVNHDLQRSGNCNNTGTCGYIEMSVLLNNSKPSFAVPNASSDTSGEPTAISPSHSTNHELQSSENSTNCNGTGTCGYVEMSALINDNSKPSSFAALNSPSKVSKHSSSVSSSSPSSNSANVQPQGSRKSTNRNSTSTCGYTEMPALINDNSSKLRSASFAVPNASSTILGQRSTVSGSANHDLQRSGNGNNTDTCGYVEMSVLLNNSKPSFAVPNASSDTSGEPTAISPSHSTNHELQSSENSTNCNSTGTCGYVEISALINDNSKPSSFAALNSPSKVSKRSSSVSSSSPSSNSANHKHNNFQPQRSGKSRNCNSTSTCGYIEMSALIKDNSKPHPVSFSVPNSPSVISEHTNHEHNNVEENHVLAYQNDIRAMSPPADGAGVNTKASITGDSGYVTLRS